MRNLFTLMTVVGTLLLPKVVLADEADVHAAKPRTTPYVAVDATAGGILPSDGKNTGQLGVRVGVFMMPELVIEASAEDDPSPLFSSDSGYAFGMGARLRFDGAVAPYAFLRGGVHHTHIVTGECIGLLGGCQDAPPPKITNDDVLAVSTGAGLELTAYHVHTFIELGGGSEGIVFHSGLGVAF